MDRKKLNTELNAKRCVYRCDKIAKVIRCYRSRIFFVFNTLICYISGFCYVKIHSKCLVWPAILTWSSLERL